MSESIVGALELFITATVVPPCITISFIGGGYTFGNPQSRKEVATFLRNNTEHAVEYISENSLTTMAVDSVASAYNSTSVFSNKAAETAVTSVQYLGNEAHKVSIDIYNAVISLLEKNHANETDISTPSPVSQEQEVTVAGEVIATEELSKPVKIDELASFGIFTISEETLYIGAGILQSCLFETSEDKLPTLGVLFVLTASSFSAAIVRSNFHAPTEIQVEDVLLASEFVLVALTECKVTLAILAAYSLINTETKQMLKDSVGYMLGYIQPEESLVVGAVADTTELLN